MNKLFYNLKLFFLCVFVFSLSYEYWDPFGVREIFTVTKLAGLFYALFSFLDINRNFSINDENRILIVNSFLLWLWLFSISLISSIIYNEGITLFLSFIQVLILFWLIYNDIRNNPRIKRYIYLFFILGVTSTSFLLSAGIGITTSSMEYERVYFMGMNPNTLGNFSALAIILIISSVFSNNNLFNRYKYLLLLLIPNLLMIIGLSGSRGSFILVFICIIIFFLLKRGSLWKKIFFVCIGAIITFIIFDYLSDFEALQRRLTSTYEEGDVGGREEIWTVVIGIIQDYPLFGLGSAGYELEMINRFGIRKDPHNLFLYIMATGGLIGMILFLIFYISILKRILHSWKINNDSSNLMIFAAVTIIISKTGGVIDSKVVWLLLATISPFSLNSQSLMKIRNTGKKYQNKWLNTVNLK